MRSYSQGLRRTKGTIKPDSAYKAILAAGLGAQAHPEGLAKEHEEAIHRRVEAKQHCVPDQAHFIPNILHMENTFPVELEHENTRIFAV